MKIIDLVEAKRIKVGTLRQTIFDVVDSVLKSGKVFVVTVHGKETAVMMPTQKLYQLLKELDERPAPLTNLPYGRSFEIPASKIKADKPAKKREAPDDHYDESGRYAGPPVKTGHMW